jgi:hypothetical protein
MSLVERRHVCGVTCHPNRENCNGYCEGKADDAATYMAEADPLDIPLPVDVTIGGGTIRKGCSVRTLVLRMEALHRAAFGDEAEAIKLLRKVATVTTPGSEVRRFLEDRDQRVASLVSMLGGKSSFLDETARTRTDSGAKSSSPDSSTDGVKRLPGEDHE